MENLQEIIDYLKESERTHFEENPSKEHIFVKAFLAEQEIKKLKEFTHTEEKLLEISRGISWDNWTKEDSPFEFFKVAEVLFCQLEWIKENLPDENDDNYEFYDTITKVQELLTAMSKDNYKNN